MLLKYALYGAFSTISSTSFLSSLLYVFLVAFPSSFSIIPPSTIHDLFLSKAITFAVTHPPPPPKKLEKTSFRSKKKRETSRVKSPPLFYPSRLLCIKMLISTLHAHQRTSAAPVLVYLTLILTLSLPGYPSTIPQKAGAGAGMLQHPSIHHLLTLLRKSPLIFTITIAIAIPIKL